MAKETTSISILLSKKKTELGAFISVERTPFTRTQQALSFLLTQHPNYRKLMIKEVLNDQVNVVTAYRVLAIGEELDAFHSYVVENYSLTPPYKRLLQSTKTFQYFVFERR